MSNDYQKRSRLVVSRGFQFKYTGVILSFIFIAAILTGYTIYFTVWIMLGERLAAVYPQHYLIDILKTVNVALFLRILFLCPFIILVGFILSNRIAGPIYSIKRFLCRVSDGEYDIILKLRKNDELQDLQESINNLVSKLSVNDKKRKRRVDILEREVADLERISEGVKIKELSDVIAEIKKSAEIIKNT